MNINEQTTEEIQVQIEATREALKEKINHLETGFNDTFKDAKSTVEGTIADVKSAFDIKQHIIKHPYIVASIVIGAGFLLSRKSDSHSQSQISSLSNLRPQNNQSYGNRLLNELKTQVRNELGNAGSKLTTIALIEIEKSLKEKAAKPFADSIERVFMNLRQKA